MAYAWFHLGLLPDDTHISELIISIIPYLLGGIVKYTGSTPRKWRAKYRQQQQKRGNYEITKDQIIS